jgi:4'-phosphopantetheinyl transferase
MTRAEQYAQSAPARDTATVHTWWSRATTSPARVWKMYQTLSDDECARALRAVSEHGFRRHVCSWGVLREILSTYTGVEPARLRIEYGRSGKPYLAVSEQYGDLRFSLAHAGEMALYAITWGSDIGVDVEEVSPRHANPELWDASLTEGEIERLLSLPEGDRAAAFARAWTRKEAVLKATGRGLAYSMTRIDALTTSNGTGATIDLDGTWNILDVPAPDSGFVSSVATRTSHPRIVTQTAADPELVSTRSNGRIA